MFKTPEEVGAIDPAALARRDRLRQIVGVRLSGPDHDGSRRLDVPPEYTADDVDVIIRELRESRWSAAQQLTAEGHVALDIAPQGAEPVTGLSTFVVPSPAELAAISMTPEAQAAIIVHTILAQMIGGKSRSAFIVNVHALGRATVAMIQEAFGRKGWVVTEGEDYRDSWLSIKPR
jgi:hypothetical protein